MRDYMIKYFPLTPGDHPGDGGEDLSRVLRLIICANDFSKVAAQNKKTFGRELGTCYTKEIYDLIRSGHHPADPGRRGASI
jgi:hypothetical protein